MFKEMFNSYFMWCVNDYIELLKCFTYVSK